MRRVRDCSQVEVEVPVVFSYLQTPRLVFLFLFNAGSALGFIVFLKKKDAHCISYMVGWRLHSRRRPKPGAKEQVIRAKDLKCHVTKADRNPRGGCSWTSAGNR